MEYPQSKFPIKIPMSVFSKRKIYNCNLHDWCDPSTTLIIIFMSSVHFQYNFFSKQKKKTFDIYCRLVLDEVSRKPTCACPFFSAKWYTDGKCYQVSWVRSKYELATLKVKLRFSMSPTKQKKECQDKFNNLFKMCNIFKIGSMHFYSGK